jgi:hypothetical protein
MKKIVILFSLVAVVASFTACNNYGTKKMFDSTELYYTKDITDAQADEIGKYLKDEGFTEGETKTVQIAKSGDTYQFRMVVKEDYDKKEDFESIAAAFAYNLSKDILNDANVEVHFCDDKLKTLKVVKMAEYDRPDYKTLSFDETEISYDNGITEQEVNNVGNYLIESGFTDGTAKDIVLLKNGETYIFQMVTGKEYYNDNEFRDVVQTFCQELSSVALDSADVEVQLCDENFEVKARIGMD